MASNEAVRELKEILAKAKTFREKEITRLLPCAVQRRHSSAGANPARQLSLQPVAVGAVDGGNDMD